MPGPIYLPHTNWKQEMEKKAGKFGKYKKESFTESVFKKEKDRVPPTAYNVWDAKANRPLGALKL